MSKSSKPAAITLEEIIQELISSSLCLYQVRLLQDRSKFRLIEKSRRIGITWALAWEAVIKRACGKKAIDLNFSSADFSASLEFIVYCKQHAETINHAAGYEAIPVNDWTLDTATFHNGSRIFALSSVPKVFRGRKDEVILDEFAFNENQDKLYGAAQPLLILDPDTQLTIVSTHDGPETRFNQFCRDAEHGKGPFSWHRTTLEDACKEGFALRVGGEHQRLLVEAEPGVYTFESFEACSQAFIEFVRSTCATEEDFAQEYECIPAKFSCLISANDYARLVLVRDDKPLEIPKTLDPQRTYGELFAGIDCGRVKDFTVVWVWERGRSRTLPPHLADVYRLVCCAWFDNMPFPAQEAAIRPIITHPCICGGYVDIGSVGRALAESVIDETGDIIQPFAFSSPKMAKAAEQFRAFVQQSRVSLHPEDVARSDVLSVRRTQIPGGPKKYAGQTKVSHGDFFWAAAIGLEAAVRSHRTELNDVSENDQEAAAQQQASRPQLN